MYDALATTFFSSEERSKTIESVHLQRRDHESFSLTKTHITHSIPAYVSFIYRMAFESSGFLASNSQHRDCLEYHEERSCVLEQAYPSIPLNLSFTKMDRVNIIKCQYPSHHSLSAYVFNGH